MKQKTILLYGAVILAVLLVARMFLSKKEGFALNPLTPANAACPAGKAKFVYGIGSGSVQAYCIDKGDYPDTSGYFPDFANSKIIAPAGVTVQAYYNKNFSQPTWKVNPGTFYANSVAPYSLKVY